MAIETIKKLRDRDWLYHQYVVENKSLSIIGKELGCNPATVYKWMIKLKITLRPVRRIKELVDKNWLYEQYVVKKKAATDIAREIGCSISQVCRLIKRMGIPKRPVSELLKGKTGRYWLGKKRSLATIEKISIKIKNQWATHIHPMKGRKHSEQARIKIKEARAGQVFTEETRKKLSLARLGKKLSEEVRKKISLANKGRPPNKGSIKGGKKHWNWQKGKTDLLKRLRVSKEYKEWVSAVFNRDYWTCQKCGRHGGTMHPHHIKPIARIFDNFLRHFNQLNTMENKEDLMKAARSYQPFWDISNGITLCPGCHRETDTYSRKGLIHVKYK